MPQRPKPQKVEGKAAGTPTQDKSTSKYTSPSDWQSRYSLARSNQTTLFERFMQWYDLAYAEVDTKSFAPWRSKVFVPLLASKLWAIIAKFVTIKPGWEVVVHDDYDQDEQGNPDDKAKRDRSEKAQKKLEYDFENPELDEPVRDKLINCLIDAVVTGTGLAKAVWKVEKHVRKEHLVKEDGSFDYKQDVEYEKDYGCNDIIPVNIFNVFVSPMATSLQAAPWIIIKEFQPLSTLKATNDAHGGSFYKNLDKLKGGGGVADEDAQYSKARNRLTNEQDPAAADSTLDLVETFECYEKSSGRICLYAATSGKDAEGKATTSWIPLRETKNPYWHGKYPLISFYVKKRPYDFWGEGIFEVSHRLQAAANDLFNHYLDNWNLSIDGMIMADQNSNIADFTLEPGGIIEYTGEKPTQFKFPEPNPSQLSIVMTEIQRSIEDNTISNYAAGNPSSKLDKTMGTATGVVRIQEAANDLIAFMRGNYNQSILQLGRFFLSNNQQFLDREVSVPLMRKNKMEMSTIGPVDLHGDLDVRLDDSSMQPMTRAERRDSFLAYTAQLIQLHNISVKQHEVAETPILKLDVPKIAEDLSRQFSQRSVDQYIMTEEEAMEAQRESTADLPSEALTGMLTQPPEEVPTGQVPQSELDLQRVLGGQAGGVEGGMVGGYNGQ